MRVSFSQTVADSAAAQEHAFERLNARVGFPNTIKILLLALFGAVAMFCVSWGYAPSFSFGNLPTWLCSTGLWAVLAILLAVALVLLYLRAGQNELSNSMAPFPIVHEVELRAEGISFQSRAGLMMYYWNGIDVIGRTDQYVFVLIKNGLCEPIPNSAFASEAELDSFVTRARACVAVDAQPG